MSACGSLSPRQSPPGSPTNPAKPETQLQTQTGERAGGAEKPWPRRPDPPAPAPSGAGWIKQTRPPGSDGRGSAQGNGEAGRTPPPHAPRNGARAQGWELGSSTGRDPLASPAGGEREAP
ncbi:unnamed protein product [Lepidochelys olivacea]